MRKIKQFIHYIKSGILIDIKRPLDILEEQINDLASLNLPILPSIIIEHNIKDFLNDEKLFSYIFKYVFAYIIDCENVIGKIYGSEKKPMLLEIILSQSIVTKNHLKIQNLGLTKKTIKAVQTSMGETSTKDALFCLLDCIFFIYEKLISCEKNKKIQKELEEKIGKMKELESYKASENNLGDILEKYSECLPKYFFDDEKQQLKELIHLIMRLSLLSEEDNSIIIKPIIYGNSISFGSFFTRNIKTGEQKLEGSFFKNSYYPCNHQPENINFNIYSNISSIEEKILTKLKKIACKIEEKKYEIYKINFVVERSKLYILDALPVEKREVQAKVKLLLDLYKRKVIKAEDVVMLINMEDLNILLHPSFDESSIKDIRCLEGGIQGAIGSTIGKVYFSTTTLIQAHKKEPKESYILCVNETYSDDVKAIEIASGVLSKTGGYASHAAVVARQYGKVCVVRPDMIVEDGKVVIDGVSIKEGDYISLHVPHFGSPIIYIGKAKLIFSKKNSDELLQLIVIASTFIKDFNVRANADSWEEAKLAIELGACGIGLCRTEHMFFQEERINIFREMIIAKTKEEKEKPLVKFKKMQRADFYKILKTVAPLPATIRLLDSPLHEVLPSSKDEFNSFLNYLSKDRNKQKYTEEQLSELIFSLKETNPMLGCRGCRMAIIHPEIYKMQLEAIFEAMCSLQLEGIVTNVEILIPLIMNERELKQIRYGKRIEGNIYFAIDEIEQNVKEKFKIKELNYKVGAMIELPASALSAGEIARYAQFFSFGTNDLTQTTLGLSRDDFNSFAPSYSMYDLLEENPFVILDENVKELMEQAMLRARLTRPDIVFGFCGEQASEPNNIRTFMEMGGSYVSTSPYTIPIALFAIAQTEITGNKQ